MNFKHSTKSKTQVTAHTMTGVQKWGGGGRDVEKMSNELWECLWRMLTKTPFIATLKHIVMRWQEKFSYIENLNRHSNDSVNPPHLQERTFEYKCPSLLKKTFILWIPSRFLNCPLILNVLVRAAIGNGVHRPKNVSPLKY